MAGKRMRIPAPDECGQRMRVGGEGDRPPAEGHEAARRLCMDGD